MNTKTIATSLVGIGGLGATVAGGYYFLKPETQLEKSDETPAKSKISNLITTSGRTLLNNNAETLEIKFHVYNNSIKSLNKITLPTNTKEGVKNWCDQIIDTEIEISKKDEENSNFNLALKLCTKPTNREKLAKNSKNFAGEGDWEGKQNSYRSKAEGEANIPTITNKAGATAAQISDWCSKTLDKEILDSGNIYDLALKWCTKD